MEEQSEKNQQERETRSAWADLPQDTLLLIIQKLHLVDVIRICAVCRNWQIPLQEDGMIIFKSRPLPWLCNLSWVPGDHSDHLQCQIIDPNSHKKFQTSKSMEKRNDAYNGIQVYGSEQGWLIAGSSRYGGSMIFMYNPYSKEYIPLPGLEYSHCHSPGFATLSRSPVSHDCRVFVLLCVDNPSFRYPYMASYSLDEDSEWELRILRETKVGCCGMQFMQEQLFVLFEDTSLRRYNIADGSWTLLVSKGSLDFCRFSERLWLIKCEGDVLVACKIPKFESMKDKCSTFYFSWANMSWVENDSTERLSSLSVSNWQWQEDCEDTKDCTMYFFEPDRELHYACFPWVEGRMKMHRVQIIRGCLDGFFYQAVIEPPRIY